MSKQTTEPTGASAGALGFAHQLTWGGACARYAVRHALLCLTIRTTERELTGAFGRGRLGGFWGMDESRITRAIEHFGCRPVEIHSSAAKTTRRRIDRYLNSGVPLIACVEEWGHWALLAGTDGENYYWVDSARSELAGASSWEELEPWLACSDEEHPFYLIAVQPRARSLLKNSLVRQFPGALPALHDRHLRRSWGVYVRALQHSFGKRGATPAAEFFDEHGPDIAERARSMRRKSSARVERILSALTGVGTAHGFHTTDRHKKKAVDAIATFIASQPLYAEPRRPFPGEFELPEEPEQPEELDEADE